MDSKTFFLKRENRLTPPSALPPAPHQFNLQPCSMDSIFGGVGGEEQERELMGVAW
jgi:hypothetical protein